MDVRSIYRAEKLQAKLSMVSVSVISVISSLCLLAVPLYLFQVYDRVLTSRSVETLIALSAIAVVLLLTFGVLDALRQIMLARIGTRFEIRVSGPILAGELSRADGSATYMLQLLADAVREPALRARGAQAGRALDDGLGGREGNGHGADARGWRGNRSPRCLR